MKLATFEKAGQRRMGAVLYGSTRLLDLATAHQAATGTRSPYLTDMLALIEGGSEALRVAQTCLAAPVAAAVYPLSAVRLLAPLPEPRQIRDCMVFEEHLKNAFAQAEKLTGRMYAIPPVWYEQPLYYKANRFSVIGPEQGVRWPAYSNVMDFELELACVLGRTGVDIPRAEAAQYILVLPSSTTVPPATHNSKKWPANSVRPRARTSIPVMYSAPGSSRLTKSVILITSK